MGDLGQFVGLTTLASETGSGVGGFSCLVHHPQLENNQLVHSYPDRLSQCKWASLSKAEMSTSWHMLAQGTAYIPSELQKLLRYLTGSLRRSLCIWLRWCRSSLTGPDHPSWPRGSRWRLHGEQDTSRLAQSIRTPSPPLRLAPAEPATNVTWRSHGWHGYVDGRVPKGKPPVLYKQWVLYKHVSESEGRLMEHLH